MVHYHTENEGIEPSSLKRQRYSKPAQYHSVQFSAEILLSENTPSVNSCPNWDLNPEPCGYKTHALPFELLGHYRGLPFGGVSEEWLNLCFRNFAWISICFCSLSSNRKSKSMSSAFIRVNRNKSLNICFMKSTKIFMNSLRRI